MRQAILKASAYLLRNNTVPLLLILFCQQRQLRCGNFRACRCSLSNHQPCKLRPSNPTRLESFANFTRYNNATCNPADSKKALESLADSRAIVNDKHNRLGDGWVLHE
jgi:hypothetical protein